MRNKLLIILGSIFVIVTLVSNKTFAQPAQEEISQFDSNIIINKDGSINVVETINYYFPIAKHGIFREIPYVKTNTDGKKYSMTFSNFAVKDLNEVPYQFSKTDLDGIITLKIGDPNITISGSHAYVISYVVKGALTYFSDHDELYWNSTGNSWQVPITDSRTNVTFPSVIAVEQVKSACYTGAASSTQSDCTTSFSNNTARAILTQPLFSYQGLTVVIGFPKGIAAVLEPTQTAAFNNPSLKGNNVTILIVFTILGVLAWTYLIYPIVIFFKWKRDDTNSKKAKVVAAWFQPPKDLQGNELSPAQTSVLVDKSVDHKDLTATIIHLAQRGYVKIKQEGAKDFRIIKTKEFENDESLKFFERFLLRKVLGFSKDEGVLISNLAKDQTFGAGIEKFDGYTSETMVENGMYWEDPHKNYIKYRNVALGSLFSLNILLAISAYFFGRLSARRTDVGIEKYGEALSLKNFLSSQEAQLNFQADKQMMFEKLLPYATAFGVEEVWAKRFPDINLSSSNWFVGDSLNTLAYLNFSQAFGSYVRSSYASYTMTTTASSSGFHSGFGGGGFSGGGGGGGGGGSW